MRQIGEEVWVLVDHAGRAPYYAREARVVSADRSTVCICCYLVPGRLFFLSHNHVFTTQDGARAARNDWPRIAIREEELPDGQL